MGGLEVWKWIHEALKRVFLGIAWVSLVFLCENKTNTCRAILGTILVKDIVFFKFFRCCVSIVRGWQGDFRGTGDLCRFPHEARAIFYTSPADESWEKNVCPFVVCTCLSLLSPSVRRKKAQLPLCRLQRLDCEFKEGAAATRWVCSIGLVPKPHQAEREESNMAGRKFEVGGVLLFLHVVPFSLKFRVARTHADRVRG